MLVANYLRNKEIKPRISDSYGISYPKNCRQTSEFVCLAYLYLEYPNGPSRQIWKLRIWMKWPIAQHPHTPLLGYNQCVTSRKEVSSSYSICCFQCFHWYLHEAKQSCLIWISLYKPLTSTLTVVCPLSSNLSMICKQQYVLSLALGRIHWLRIPHKWRHLYTQRSKETQTSFNLKQGFHWKSEVIIWTAERT